MWIIWQNSWRNHDNDDHKDYDYGDYDHHDDEGGICLYDEGWEYDTVNDDDDNDDAHEDDDDDDYGCGLWLYCSDNDEHDDDDYDDDVKNLVI